MRSADHDAAMESRELRARQKMLAGQALEMSGC